MVPPSSPQGLSRDNLCDLAADSSRRAALLVCRIFTIFSLLVPCRPGDSTPISAHLIPGQTRLLSGADRSRGSPGNPPSGSPRAVHAVYGPSGKRATGGPPPRGAAGGRPPSPWTL